MSYYYNWTGKAISFWEGWTIKVMEPEEDILTVKLPNGVCIRYTGDGDFEKFIPCQPIPRLKETSFIIVNRCCDELKNPHILESTQLFDSSGNIMENCCSLLKSDGCTHKLHTQI